MRAIRFGCKGGVWNVDGARQRLWEVECRRISGPIRIGKGNHGRERIYGSVGLGSKVMFGITLNRIVEYEQHRATMSRNG